MSSAVDTFFDKFGELADDAELIPQVRKFIVSALIHESLSATEAITTAEKIRSEHKTAAAKQGVTPAVRRSKDSDDLSTDDLPPQFQDIPVALFGRLDEVATIEKGLSPIQKTKPGPYPLVVTAEERGSSETFDFVGPAVAIPMVSSTGHGDASLKRIHYQEGEFAAGNILSVVKPACPKIINARFLYEYLTVFKDELLVARMSGTANVSLTINKLKEVPVPLITGSSLQRLDALMAQCDRLEEQLRERDTRQAELARAALARFAEAPTTAHLNLLFHDSFTLTPADLRKTILTLAVQGKLVPQDSNDEPASNLRQPDEELIAQSSFDVPNCWTWTRLETLAEINGGFAFKSTDYAARGTRVIRISDFDEFGFKDHKLVRHPFTPELQKFTLAQNNILMAMTGGTVGKSYFVKSLPEPMIVNQRVATIKVSESAAPRYIDVVIRSEMTQEVIRKAKNSTNDNISMGDIKGFAVPLPPLAEQRRIVAKVDQLMALVDEWEARLTATRTTASQLLDALVAELTAPGEQASETTA